jgi:hypothetical protein
MHFLQKDCEEDQGLSQAWYARAAQSLRRYFRALHWETHSAMVYCHCDQNARVRSPHHCCSRGYTVIEAGGESRRKSIVRDEVSTRVLRCARHNGIRRFWIDREYSPLEDDSEEKQVTTDSMDLLYRESRRPIGLLAVIL